MSANEEVPVISDVENAKKSDGTSSAGEHAVDKVNEIDQVQPSEETKTEEKQENGTEENNNDESTNNSLNNKRDIDEVEKDDEQTNGEQQNGDQEEAAVSTTTATNKKVKTHDPLPNENGDNNDGTESIKPNDELTVV